ncbi:MULTISPECIES: hypothetical protein [unclassified Mesorhizobium]|uniref:ArsR/SmtB family transcription factor n=1 Tax=unclassified Mesorhizobium TaxID=325217 RepID=UPI000FCC02C8|nr:MULTISPECIES: hypothetical protein [unclassified Mesorhizobium]RUX93734.1 hypothetical protein EN993_18340 [Mesorhizobium sp. M7D.F.Ca.US.004.01.2.1]RVA34805.1 hypothetical protein EN935_05715 [Mesorhizobium sp. M7D.F.Ca.US.004.03.1.1]
MSDNAPSIEQFDNLLNNAVSNEDWAAATVSRDRLKALLLDALISGNSDDIALIENALSRVRAKLALDRGIELGVGPEATTWMLAADIGTARLAQRLRPMLQSSNIEASAKDKVLKAISSSNRNGVTNSQIQKRTGLRAETVTRCLQALRTEGLVRSRKVGRLRINQLANKGKPSAAINDVNRTIFQRQRKYAAQNKRYVVFPLTRSDDFIIVEKGNVQVAENERVELSGTMNIANPEDLSIGWSDKPTEFALQDDKSFGFAKNKPSLRKLMAITE